MPAKDVSRPATPAWGGPLVPPAGAPLAAAFPALPAYSHSNSPPGSTLVAHATRNEARGSIEPTSRLGSRNQPIGTRA